MKKLFAILLVLTVFGCATVPDKAVSTGPTNTTPGEVVLPSVYDDFDWLGFIVYMFV